MELSWLIKIREDSTGKISLSSSDREDVMMEEEASYPLIIKSKSIKHSIFVVRKT